MTRNEEELFALIRENDKPELAVLTAIEIFTAFLEQPGASQAPPVVCPLESA